MGISQKSSGDSEYICISLVVAVVEIYSSDKKEMDSLVPISVLQTMCAHILNKHLKNKDSQRSKQPKDLDSQFFPFVAFGKISRCTKVSRVLILSIVRMKIFEEGT